MAAADVRTADRKSWDGKTTCRAARLERCQVVGGGQIRLRRLRDAGPISGVLEMHGIRRDTKVPDR